MFDRDFWDAIVVMIHVLATALFIGPQVFLALIAIPAVRSIEDASVRSQPTTVVNLEVGYTFEKRWKLGAAIYNVLDSDDNDITYYYESQLADEAAPVRDVHFHPVEPRTVRLSVGLAF